MAIHLVNIIPKHERRIRLLFDNSPASGAFGASPTTLGYYSVVSQDGRSSDSPVAQAIAVAGQPNVLELALGADLTSTGVYLVSVTGMPCTDASTCTGSQVFAFGAPPGTPNLEIPEDDYASLLYGIDIVHNGTDFAEDATGDLASQSGLSNAQTAVRRIAFAEPLPWEPDYGAHARQFVDGTPGAMPTLKGQLVQKIQRDARVKTVAPTLLFDDADPSIAYYDVAVILIGGENVSVPNVSVNG